MSILKTIIENKKAEVLLTEKKQPLQMLRESDYYNRTTFSLKKGMVEKSGIIAEFKRQSPSKGVFNSTIDPWPIVGAYQKFGASGISILTDSRFFGGSVSDILQVREHTKIPILRKDFMISEYQFHEAKAIGADVILLIAACLTPAQAKEYTQLAHELGLEVILEIHSEAELQHYNADMDFVGINNRNLKNFQVDLQHSVRLKSLLPSHALTIAESGISRIQDLEFLKEKGFEGFLMGEIFMKEKNPGLAFEKLMENFKNI